MIEQYERESSTSYFVLKVGDEYFQDAWEDYPIMEDDEVNYSFTTVLDFAHRWYGGDWDAPKYLFNPQTGKSIKTLKEAQDFLSGEILKVTKTVVTSTTFKVEKVDS